MLEYRGKINLRGLGVVKANIETKQEGCSHKLPKSFHAKVEILERCADGYMVYLRNGYCAFGGKGCHSFGEDTLADVKSSLLAVGECDCAECAENAMRWQA